MTGCPMPVAWEATGVLPPGAVAAYAEGMCPVHPAPLDAGVVRHGGKAGVPVRWVPAGWCDGCAAWWWRAGAGLGATWDTRDRP